MSTDLLTIDFETYYDGLYSLSKLTNEEYVRDPRFEIIGVSVKVNDGVPEWFSGTHAQVGIFLSNYSWETSAAVAHNAPFDMSILSYHFGIRPKLILDTLSMARAVVGMHVNLSLDALAKFFSLGVKGREVIAAIGKHREDFSPEGLANYGAYCCNDGDLTYDLFNVLRGYFPKDEIQLIDLTIRMATEPVFVLDRPTLVDHLADVVERKAALLDALGQRFGKDVFMSNPKFADALRSFGIEPPMKTSVTTGKLTYAFAKKDEDFIALAEHPNPDVQALVAARLGLKSTLEETRTMRLLDIADRGALPIALRYYAAHTGRWGGAEKINPQNFPRKSKLKRALRAPPGYVVVDADSSQIEARVLAWLAGEWDLVDAFARGEDTYRIMASDIYGCTPEEASTMQRFVGKTTVLSAGFGVAEVRLQAALATADPPVFLPLEECALIIHAYRRKHQRIVNLWYEGNNALSAIATNRTCKLGEHGVLTVEGADGIRLPNGMRLEYPNLRWEAFKEGERPNWIYDTKLGKTKRRVKIYGASLTENFVQALARIVVGEQMLLIRKRYKVALTVHDAVCAIVPEREQDEAVAFIEACMKTRPAWAPDLPLNCEVGSGPSYGDC